MEEQKKDKFKAVWLSHSSIGDYLKCPRLYYLRNVYKDLRTGHKFTVMTPPLALGQSVHEVVEALSVLGVEERFNSPILKNFEKAWEKVIGDKGGFKNEEQEGQYKERGRKMIKNLVNNPGPLKNKAIKIKSDGLPYYWFNEEENIILCGKIDWIEYLEEDDSIHIIDFKTGRNEENGDSLQLPIYLLLATNLQKRKIKKASYWYLDKEDGLKEVTLPDIKESEEKIAKIASRIKLARKLEHFACADNGCKHCYPFERVLRGDGIKVAESEYGQDIFIIKD